MADVDAHTVVDASGRPARLDELCERVTLHVRGMWSRMRLFHLLRAPDPSPHTCQ